ncbi:hypothetical protein QZH41_003532 [Actinostola sp. cb2023]|nr:hypothetical protein QZH41_003532 [Actinostola sp. cb2023]
MSRPQTVPYIPTAKGTLYPDRKRLFKMNSTRSEITGTVTTYGSRGMIQCIQCLYIHLLHELGIPVVMQLAWLHSRSDSKMDVNMDKELTQLLESYHLDLKETFLKHKVYTIDTVKMLTELQFEKMGVAIGQVASLQAVLGSGSSKAPILRTKPNNFTLVAIGRPVRLQCQISTVSQDFTTYKWYKNGAPLHFENNNRLRVKRMRYLKIKNTKKTDNGKYTCVAKNACGSVNVTMKLVVGTPPQLIVEKLKRDKTLIAVPVGNSIMLDCSASGYPQPLVKWYKDGKPFTHRIDGPLYLSAHEFVLGLKFVIPSDSGIYTCNVTNAYGWFNHTYRVDVRERVRAKPVLHDIDNVTVWVGENATLECNATSVSIPHFQWIRWFTPTFNATTNTTMRPYDVVNKQIAQDSSRYILRPKSNKKFAFHGVKLMLVNVSKADEGKYTCLVGNAVGYNIEHGYLIVRSLSEMTTPVASTESPPTIHELVTEAYLKTQQPVVQEEGTDNLTE